ncbi:universal stress protein [Caballeronia sp. ATUFL_M2_KS44]|uniref:universal stress protein n=1 Tax=Caballeronia sp. ATUFL_M2_KS44 TaxID=2921767 RepID=UPI0020294260|nr:universal stress protein [Caballeronia sp. ATUFL_M2_KS44]
MASYRRILLCYNATAEGRCALRLGAQLARELHAETHLLAVLDDTEWTRGLEVIPAVSFELEQETAKEVLREGVNRLANLGVVARGHLAIGNPMMQIPSFAKALDIDLIVVGHHPSGLLYRWWTGQDDGRLLDRVSCSVLVAMEPQER